MKRVMGLDASSTTIGLCILDYDDDIISLVHVEFVKPSKKGNLFERLSKVRQYIHDKIDEFNPDEGAIEDIILFMGGKKCPLCKKPMGGATTAKTITTLAVLNRTVGLAIMDKLNKHPYLYNAMRIRHAIKEDKALPAKEEIPELVAKILNIDFPYKLNRNKKIAQENGDMADAIAVGICHVYMDRLGKSDELQIPKKKTRKKRSKK